MMAVMISGASEGRRKRREVAFGNVLLPGNNMHGQIGVLHQAFLDVVSAGDDPEQAGIGCRLIIGVLDKHPHFAADPLQPSPHRQCQNVLRVLVRLASLPGQFEQLRIKELEEEAPTDSDLDAIGLDVDATDKCNYHGSNLVSREASEFFCNLATTLDQPVLSNSVDVFIADGIEDCPLIGKEGSKPGDHKVLEVAGWDAPSL